MIFKLNENENIELQYSFRSSIYFEQITNHSLDMENFNSNDLLTLFYCVVIASLQKAKKPIITMLDFMDTIDNYNNGEKCLVDFSKWYIGQLEAQYNIQNASDVKEENEEKKSQ